MALHFVLFFTVDFSSQGANLSTGIWIAIISGAIAIAIATSVIVTVLIVRRRFMNKNALSRRRMCKFNIAYQDFYCVINPGSFDIA